MSGDSVFLDAGGWVALLNQTDELHALATSNLALQRRHCRIVLTDWIVAETGNGLAKTPARTRFAEAVATICQSPRLELVYLNPPLLQRAVVLYRARPDQTWGLVDCASFIVMQDREIVEAFTFDHHFEQAGFRALIRSVKPA